MSKIKIGTSVFPCPMPMCLVGANVDGVPNFMAVAWFNRVNYKPPLFGCAVNKAHLTAVGIEENHSFSINIPGRGLLVETDYCGIVSGRKVDKSQVFEVFYGELKTAPMIRRCPLCIELRLIQTVTLPSNKLFIGEVVAAYCEEGCITETWPDPRKIDPFVLTMPDNGYWALGEPVGKAWAEGRKYGSRQED